LTTAITVAKFRRLQLGLSTYGVAELAGPGLTQPQVSLIENLVLKPSPSQLAKLAHALRVTTPAALLQEVQLVDAQRAVLEQVVAA
jgi:transcriptional regulator with XRE-family HTH domain